MTSQEYIIEHTFYPENDLNYQELIKLDNGKSVLCMGVGAGREAKLLVSKNMKVVGVEFDSEMINKSREIEPNAEYHYMNILDYLKANENKKFDYIIAMYNFLSGFKKEEYEYIVDTSYKMLNKGGMFLTTIKLVEYTPKGIMRRFFRPYHSFTRKEVINLVKNKRFEFEGKVLRIYK